MSNDACSSWDGLAVREESLGDDADVEGFSGLLQPSDRFLGRSSDLDVEPSAPSSSASALRSFSPVSTPLVPQSDTRLRTGRSGQEFRWEEWFRLGRHPRGGSSFAERGRSSGYPPQSTLSAFPRTPMNYAFKIAPVPAPSLETSPPSLREVAAYLRGVADATTALSQPPDGATVAEAAPTSSRKTLPYDGGGRKGDTIPAGRPVDFPELEALEDLVMGGEEGGREEPFVDERPSGVRLRVGKLAPGWYDLLGKRAG